MSSRYSDDELKSIVNDGSYSVDEQQTAFEILEGRYGLAAAQEFVMFGEEPTDG